MTWSSILAFQYALLSPLYAPLIIVTLLGVQILLGRRIIRLHGRIFSFRHVHIGIGITLAVLFVYHGFSPLLTLSATGGLWNPFVLPVGIALLGLLAFQILVGFKVVRTGRRFSPVHLALAITLVGVGMFHGVTIATGLVHPSQAECSSCHIPPANHSAPPCAHCHKQPGVSWVFAHPAFANEEHSWRSFACDRCHPSIPDYTKVYCSCHNGRPPTGG